WSCWRRRGSASASRSGARSRDFRSCPDPSRSGRFSPRWRVPDARCPLVRVQRRGSRRCAPRVVRGIARRRRRSFAAWNLALVVLLGVLSLWALTGESHHRVRSRATTAPPPAAAPSLPSEHETGPLEDDRSLVLTRGAA